jgi:hypothetical protein
MPAPRRHPPDLQASGGEAALITSFGNYALLLMNTRGLEVSSPSVVGKEWEVIAGDQNDLKERGRREWRAAVEILCYSSWFLDHHHLSGSYPSPLAYGWIPW